MDGFPGLIHSGDDFGINPPGIMVTETTIRDFSGFDTKEAEFVRARKAMQYAASIDERRRLFKDGNNGGYANDWLVADTKTNEIASLELGLKHVTLERKPDGYFVGSNFPINPKLAARRRVRRSRHEAPCNARHKRLGTVDAENKGKIDIASGQRFLGDHIDTLSGKNQASERTLCGHLEFSNRGMGAWQPPFAPAGTVQNKVTDAAMAEQMSFTALAGHACGISYKAEVHLKEHPEFGCKKNCCGTWMPVEWTTFSATR